MSFFFFFFNTLVSCSPKLIFYLQRRFVLFFSLPGYNESHSKPALSSRSGGDRGTASHTWRTQNAVNRTKETSLKNTHTEHADFSNSQKHEYYMSSENIFTTIYKSLL